MPPSSLDFDPARLTRRQALATGAAALGAVAWGLPLSAGSGADGAIRAISTSLAKALGQAIVIENLPGAGGITGTTQIVRAHEPARRLFAAALECNRAIGRPGCLHGHEPMRRIRSIHSSRLHSNAITEKILNRF